MADAFLSAFSTAPVGVAVNVGPVQKDGGYVISATLTGLADGTYRIHAGPVGDDVDPAFYAGPGFGDEVVIAGGAFTCVSPPMPVGGPYRFTFVDIFSGAKTVSLPALQVVPHHFRSRVISLRRFLPPNWRLGWRSARTEKFPQ